jgi:arylsulfatase A-like enzyme
VVFRPESQFRLTHSHDAENLSHMRAVLTVVLFVWLLPAETFASGNARHIVVVVWDGMRRDFATEQYAPALHGLMEEGVFFDNHRPAYPSTTEVNGTAIATGSYPANSHVIANTEFRRGIDPRNPVGTESLAAVRKGDQLSRGHYLNMPTVAEILQAHGHRTAIAGSKPVALLHVRAERTDASRGVTLFEG